MQAVCVKNASFLQQLSILMNPFQSFALLLFVTLGLISTPTVSAAESQDVTYVGTLSGVECTACKRTISRSLAKIKGVKTIRIVKQGESLHRLEVATNGSREITKSDAVNALKKAEHYKILTWAKSSGS